MSEQLGKVEKPEAEHFTHQRKLYIVPLVFSGKESPPEYIEKFNLYWEQVNEQIANLESKIGKVSYIFHEAIAQTGDEGIKAMDRINPPGCRIVRDRCKSGASFEATEDKELNEESMDWERFLLAGFISQKAARKVSELYVEASRKRYEHIARRIDETLKDREAGILFIREGHMVQFPKDIAVFSVTPPALDEIQRWLRSREAESKED
jgi:hypothetical protein